MPVDTGEQLSRQGDATPDPETGGEKRTHMGFLEHLEELRWTLIKCAIVFVVMVSLIAFFLQDFMGFLSGPLDSAKDEYPQLASGLVTTSPVGVFTVLIQVCLLGGLLLSLPFFLFFVAQFVAPALTKKEMNVLLPACFSAFALFLIGAAFSYFLLVPAALEFSLRFNQMLGFNLVWAADRYYALLVWMVLGLGVTFQFPLIILVLVYLGIVDVAKLRRGRRIMIVVFFIVAAILTPTPDPFVQALVALPMWVLYELSILASARLKLRRNSEDYEPSDS